MSKRSATQETANVRAAPTTLKHLAPRPISMKTLAVLAPLSAALIAGPLTASAATPSAASLEAQGDTSAQTVHVTVQDGTVDLRARDVSLATVLEALATEAGYEIEIYGNPTSPATSWSLDGVPVAKALFRLAGDNSFVLCPVGPRGVQILKVYGPAEGETAAPVIVRRAATKSAAVGLATGAGGGLRGGAAYDHRPCWPARISTATSACRSCMVC